MGELGGIGAELRHHDAEVDIGPRGTDRLLHEPSFERERPEVAADVDDAVLVRREAEVLGDLGHGSVVEQVAVHGGGLEHRHVLHAVAVQVRGEQLHELRIVHVRAVAAVVAQHERHADRSSARPIRRRREPATVEARFEHGALVGVDPSRPHYHRCTRPEGADTDAAVLTTAGRPARTTS